jgi:hypothetical protein
MKKMTSKMMLLAFIGLVMLASCEYDYYVVPAPVPKVTSTDPANTDTGVSLKKTITVTFDQDMIASTINNSTFTLSSGATQVAGTVSSDGSTASFVPSSLLALNTTYTGTITTNVKNTYGVSIASNYIWTFKTGADTTSNDTTIVVTDTISFSQDILPIFSAQCEVCHSGSTPPDLRANKAYNSLINGNYVIPEDADNSILYQEMKTGGMKVYTNAANTKLVKRWIDAGAKNN